MLKKSVLYKVNFYLIRHTETAWNKEGRLQGQIDVPLSCVGYSHAYLIGSWLASKNITALYSSDLSRAYVTAALIASQLNLVPAQDCRLREIDAGIWSGLYTRDLIQKQREAWLSWRHGYTAPDYGETYLALQTRSMEVLNQLSLQYRDARIAIVSHSGAIRTILASIIGATMEEVERSVAISAGSITTIEFTSASGFRVKNIAQGSMFQNNRLSE